MAYIILNNFPVVCEHVAMRARNRRRIYLWKWNWIPLTETTYWVSDRNPASTIRRADELLCSVWCIEYCICERPSGNVKIIAWCRKCHGLRYWIILAQIRVIRVGRNQAG